MAVIDDVQPLVRTLFALVRPCARQRDDERAAEQAFQTIVVETHAQAVADQPGRNGVEDSAQHEAAAAGDGDQNLVVIRGAPRRQRLQRCAFQ